MSCWWIVLISKMFICQICIETSQWVVSFMHMQTAVGVIFHTCFFSSVENFRKANLIFTRKKSVACIIGFLHLWMRVCTGAIMSPTSKIVGWVVKLTAVKSSFLYDIHTVYTFEHIFTWCHFNCIGVSKQGDFFPLRYECFSCANMSSCFKHQFGHCENWICVWRTVKLQVWFMVSWCQWLLGLYFYHTQETGCVSWLELTEPKHVFS